MRKLLRRIFGKFSSSTIYFTISAICLILVLSIVCASITHVSASSNKTIAAEFLVEENITNSDIRNINDITKNLYLSTTKKLDENSDNVEIPKSSNNAYQKEENKQNEKIYYIAKYGDSFWSISEKYYNNGNYCLALQNCNGYSNKTLKAGDKIYIPEKDSEELKYNEKIIKKEKTSTTIKKEEVKQPSNIIDKETIQTSKYNIIKTYDVPSGHSFKSYTNYKLLSKSSPQGKLQQKAYTDSVTGIRMVDGYYCAALGTYYDGNIGDKFLVTLSSGNQFKMVLCDVKSDRHTDAKHQYTRANGCVIEFYVDYSVLSSSVKRMGNISYINGFEGDISLIQKIQN